MKLRKRILTLILAIAMLIVTLPFAAAEGYCGWKQYDPRWASVVLTNKTMKQVGCLATSVAMLAVQGGLRDEAGFDPGIFAAEMKKAGGFDANDDLVWEALPKAVPGLTAQTPWGSLKGTQAEKTALLKGWLEQGYQVAVAVKSGGHWVALRAVTGGKAVMLDPGSEETDLFGKYPASGVSRAALLRCEKPASTQAVPAEKEGASMLENVLAFMKDLWALLAAVFRYMLILGK